jgi:hypothetical protein
MNNYYKIVKVGEDYNIHYFEMSEEILIEFYAKDLLNPIGFIRQGYTKHPDSL